MFNFGLINMIYLPRLYIWPIYISFVSKKFEVFVRYFLDFWRFLFYLFH